MSNLGEFGILPPRSAVEPRYQERTTISHQEFCKHAGEFLLNLSEIVVSDSIPNLESYPAEWQPMGFQIYNLGIYPELGFLRLHVWPEDSRRATQKTDIIHNHSRHIASTVLSGIYRDSLFDVHRVVNHEDEPRVGRYTVYGKAINPDQTEALLSEAVLVEASVTENRRITTGNQHFIEPDIFHQTRIPLAESCVTLVFNSFRTRADGPYMLLDEPPSPTAALREAITPEEVDGVKKLFM
jgi:hypothetical protein